MGNKMLIDATHPEETRVVVVRGNRVEDFDFEAANRKQLRGNIYLAKVTRVEPSLQAAFVEYGGNRHGFLAFSEIHPDYYQIPAADRARLLEEEERAAREEERNERRRRQSRPARAARQPKVQEEAGETGAEAGDDEFDVSNVSEVPHDESDDVVETVNGDEGGDEGHLVPEPSADEAVAADDAPEPADGPVEADAMSGAEGREDESDDEESDDGRPVEAAGEEFDSVGAEDALEEVPERRFYRMRQYKIQEVIKRRQVLLIQVVKEERGNKGAALTTYLSLAGRYSVLMPNSGRGGGISRKITNVQDRKRLRQVAEELEVPDGMGVILRTAGAARTKQEIKRDFEYLMRLWDNVRDLTLKSTAPALVYEEGSLVKRSIRDLYNKDIDEILVAGPQAYREARDFMRMLMPSHARNVQPYQDLVPIFARFGVEPQLDAMFSPQVTLKSGGYLVINQTEALVAIDVNSGRSTREHNIEDTALTTNLETADEVARQLRLRDLAGLIVIDFIDMEEMRNNRSVERRLKDALRNDRARIQVGRISHFGLMEMSRQRIRTGVLEGSTEVCPHCLGAGLIRSTESVALHVLRALEDYLLRSSNHHVIVHSRTQAALYILNHKRQHLADLEGRFGLHITILADDHVGGAHFAFERGELLVNRPAPVLPVLPVYDLDGDDDDEPVEPEEEVEEAIDNSEAGEAEASPDTANRRRRRPRRRRGDKAGEAGTGAEVEAGDSPEIDQEASPETGEDAEENGGEGAGDDEPRRRRRRGRRGGRRGRGERGEAATGEDSGEEPAAEAVEPADGEVAEPAAEPINDAEPPVEDRPAPDAEDKPAPEVEDDRSEQPAVPRAQTEIVASEPKVSSSAVDEPKRTGWWSRRGGFL